MITLEQLAKAMGKKVVKDRIYMWDLGYNTKKTKCHAYVYVMGDEFRAAAYIECPTQPPQWIAHEEAKVRERVMKRVIEACKTITST
jgi:hypothetical protein